MSQMNCRSYHIFNVLSNRTRWQIILSLYISDKCVSEICKETGQEQSKISHNLKILGNCNIVFSKRDGKKIIYSLNKDTIKPIITIIKKHMEKYCDNNCFYKK